MNWFSILKADIRNEAQYKAASLTDRTRFHYRQRAAYSRRLQALRTHHTVDLTDVENPVYQEMKQYQEMRNFHKRQAARLKRCIGKGKTECNDFYSPELEGDNREYQKLNTTPTGKLDPYVELSLEAYNDLTDEQKLKYHAGMLRKGIDVNFHGRMAHRLKSKSRKQLPTFPSTKYGGERFHGKEYTKEEYLNMDGQGKSDYHSTMHGRFRKNGNKELVKFHTRMYQRIKSNSNLPTYFSPEHEQEEQ